LPERQLQGCPDKPIRGIATMHAPRCHRATSRLLLSRAHKAALPTALALCLAATVSPVRAQSLLDLYESARSYDATFLAARSDAEAVAYRVGQAKAAWLPNVSLQAGSTYNKNSSAAEYWTDETSPPGGYRYGENDHYRTNAVTITAQQNIYNAANNRAVDQAQRSLDLAQAQAQSAEQDLMIRLSQAYFDVLASQDALATLEASKKAIAEQLASAQRNFEVGTATITDSREAQSRYDLAVAQEIAAANDLRVKQLALSQLVGLPAAKPLPLAMPVALPQLRPAQMDDWLIAADRYNASITQAQLSLEVAQLETERAKAGHLPTVALNASLGYNKMATGSQDLSYHGYYDTSTRDSSGRTGSVGINVNVPLFSGFATQDRIKETLKLEDKARNQLDGARRTAAQSTRSLFLGFQTGLAQVKALEAAEASSKLALEATEMGYKVGVRVNVDVLNAQTQLYTTERDLAKARYDVILDDLKLRQASGQLNLDDLRRINGLLAR
jgi:outer membrane protein